MHLFNKSIPVVIPELTPAVAQSIYASLKETNNKENTIATGLFRPEHVLDTYNEIQALEEVAEAAMMREDSPKTQKGLEAELSSDILDVPTFVLDYVDHVLVYKENSAWEEFVEQFDYLKTQNEI